MASNRDESHPPPRKSRRLATRSTRESVQIPLARNVQNSVQSQLNELLTAAIPIITQSVITALQQSGIILNTNQTQSDPQCRAQSGDTVQSLTTTQNDIQIALSPIPTANISDQATTAITQDSQSTVHSNNVQLISLPGSIDIPRTDLSPSVNQQPTSVNSRNDVMSLQTTGTATYSLGTHALDNLMSGTGTDPILQIHVITMIITLAVHSLSVLTLKQKLKYGLMNL